ncbi:hypothetical protein [Aromatoleum evansii]|uniref:hypothetical protein n=1 Tax=Aromatoleum evansii TaxID=59406 RepID=UPI00145E0D2E|nr:hypothetical protein [Aromatoleum evansii]NMG32344.1 hypothetical protein [Aromatoleum evansii]
MSARVVLHPFLASAELPFMRLRRACFWQLADTDFRHAAYWRVQVEECVLQLVAWLMDGNGSPEAAQRCREAVTRAMVSGWSDAAYRRVQVEVPAGGVCPSQHVQVKSAVESHFETVGSGGHPVSGVSLFDVSGSAGASSECHRARATMSTPEGAGETPQGQGCAARSAERPQSSHRAPVGKPGVFDLGASL